MSDDYGSMPLIGEKAPLFEAKTTQGKVNFPNDYRGKWVVFFSHPADFSPVCTTEFMAFAAMQEDFKALNAELLGLSIDSNFSHIAWLRAIKEKAEYKGMKDIEVAFPVIGDPTMEVSRKYGMLQPSASNNQAVRAVFIIDTEAVVRAVLCYPLANGRNIDEIKRLLIAMQRSDEHDIITPANWNPGEEVAIPSPSSCRGARERLRGAAEEGYRYLDWFFCLKDDPG